MKSFKSALTAAFLLATALPAGAAALQIKDGNGTLQTFDFFQDGSGNYFGTLGIWGLFGDYQADVNSSHQLLVSASGSVTANAGTNLNTSLLATDAHLTALGTSALATDAHLTTFTSANHTDLSTLNTTLGTPMQSSGGTVTVTQATAANLKAQVSVASGSIASGAIASGAIASGALASGSISSGAAVSGAFATGAITDLALAQGSTTSGEVGNLPLTATTTAAPTYTTAKSNPLSTTTAGSLRSDMSSVGGTALALGQTTMSASIPVALASNQSAVTVSQGTAANLNMTCANCSGSGAGGTDNGGFTAGSSIFAPLGGVYFSTATANPVTASGDWAAAQLTHYRALQTDWYNSSGTEMGTSGSPVQVSLANTGSNSTAVTVGQATAASLNATVVGTGTFATQLTGSTNNINNISGTVSLPTGAATAANQTNASQKTQIVDGSGNVIASTSNNLDVQCANCSGSGISTADGASWTAGTSLFAGIGGAYQTTATSNPLTAGDQGFAQLTRYRALMSDWYNSSGAEMGTSGSPVQVSIANTGANGTAMLVTGTGGTFPVTGTFWQTTQPVSVASLPLPTGASTSANQPTNAAIGSTTSGQTGNLDLAAVTTGAPTYTTGQSDPLSLTTAGALRVDASATTQPVSGSVSLTGSTNNINNISGTVSLPTGAATSANQPTAAAPGSTSSGQTGNLAMGFATTANPTDTTADTYPLSLDTAGNLRTVDKADVAQGSTTTGQVGNLMQGAVTTSSPSYTAAQTSPLSLDTAGNLRVNVVAGGGSGGTSSSVLGDLPLDRHGERGRISVLASFSDYGPDGGAPGDERGLAACHG